jgi:hypothetical protein
MYKLLRIGLFALPLAGGAAWAQGARGTPIVPPVTDDTRTPLQQKAGRLDDTTPALPGDATKPSDIPNTVPKSDRTGLPEDASGAMPAQPEEKPQEEKKPQPRTLPRSKVDESTLERKSDVDHDSTKMQNKLNESDLGTRDELNSDK